MFSISFPAQLVCLIWFLNRMQRCVHVETCMHMCVVNLAAGRMRKPHCHSLWLLIRFPHKIACICVVVFLINKGALTNSTKIPEMHVLHKLSQVSSLLLLALSTECFGLIRFGGSQMSPMCMKWNLIVLLYLSACWLQEASVFSSL